MHNKVPWELRGILFLITVILLSTAIYSQSVESEDFNKQSLDNNVWTFIDPVGDCSYSLEGYNTGEAFVKLDIPAGVSHDIWESGNFSARLMQNVSDIDFEIEAKYLSTVTEKFQSQGILVQQDENNFIRSDFYFDGDEIRFFVAKFENGIPTTLLNQLIATTHTDPFYLSIIRLNDSWKYRYSLDGVNYTLGINFNFPLNVSKAGIFAGNHGTPASASPGFTALVDYFFNKANPLDPEDNVKFPPQSEDFNKETLDTDLWQFIDPLGDCSFTLNGYNSGEATLKIDVSAGQSHDAWINGNFSARVMQEVLDESFEIEVKFLSDLTATYQSQGILVEEDDDSFIRFDFYFGNGSVKLFAAVLDNGNIESQEVLDFYSPYTGPLYLRVGRNKVNSTDTWVAEYSIDGVSFLPGHTFDYAIDVTKVGVFAGNAGSNPAFTAVVDYFFNTVNPIDPEDEVTRTTPSNDSPTLLAEKNIELMSVNLSEGNYFSNGDIKFGTGSHADHTGNFTAVDKIKIEKRKTVYGDVTAGGSVNNKGTVNGNVLENQQVERIELPQLNFNAGGNNVTVQAFGSKDLEPGSYDNVTVRPFGTLNLESGVYYFEKLTLNLAANLVAEVSGGEIVINVTEEIKFGIGAEVELLPNGESDSDQITFNSLQSKKLKIYHLARVFGNIIAPESEVVLYDFAKFKGFIAASEITAKNNSFILGHASQSLLPKNINVDYYEFTEDEAQEVIVTEYELDQNYPNPFNPSTTIRFSLPEKADVKLDIFNILGEHVDNLLNAELNAGIHEVKFNALNLSSGVYIYRLEANNFVKINKMTLSK